MGTPALTEQKRQLEAERGTILARRESWHAAQERLDSLEAWCRTVRNNLSGGTYEQKREALDIFGARVKLYERHHSPRYEITFAIGLEDIVATSPGRC